MNEQKAVRINGGKGHVWRPGIRRITRCGIRAKRGDTVTETGASAVPPASRCRKCFPGTARAEQTTTGEI